jgi:divalent metal cation (Fe/Co/Zn/Cd) transporter
LWLSGVSITWTGITSLIAIGYGLRAGSVVLAAFGAVGLFDLIGSTALVVHFRHALHHEAFSERHERVAHLVVAGGMVIVGVATLAASAIRLASSSHTDEPVVGLITAAASIAVLALLGHRKRVVGRRIPSAALVTDGWLSLTGASTAACAVVGLVLSDAYGWTWVDPTTALGVATAAIVTAIFSLRSAGSDSP